MVSFTREQYIICSHSWATLRMSRSLFVSSYLQATFSGLSVNEKEEKCASNDNKKLLDSFFASPEELCRTRRMLAGLGPRSARSAQFLRSFLGSTID